MEMLDLPDFDIPDHSPKIPPLEVIYRWLAENVRRLKESGQMDRLRGQLSRQPADARFSLPRS